jgi:DNA-binding MarR family transcriptional regulator
MVASGTVFRIEALAQDVFHAVTQFCLTLPRHRRRSGELKDSEFLTLVILHARGTMIVGDIQRLLGVLPAQMSRVIRSLEERHQPLIACQINPRDKRKIDVCLTQAGEDALREHEELRIQSIKELLGELSEAELGELAHLLDKLHMGRSRNSRPRAS